MSAGVHGAGREVVLMYRQPAGMGADYGAVVDVLFVMQVGMLWLPCSFPLAHLMAYVAAAPQGCHYHDSGLYVDWSSYGSAVPAMLPVCYCVDGCAWKSSSCSALAQGVGDQLAQVRKARQRRRALQQQPDVVSTLNLLSV